jgi:hypothetical protein
MAVTSVTYTGDGSTVLFSIPFPYLSRDDVQVEVDGSGAAFTFANDTTIEFGVAPDLGAAIKIIRSTNDAGLRSTFTPGASIRSNALTGNFEQALFIAQETANKAAEAVLGDLPDGSISTSKLATGVVTTAKLGDLSVAEAKIADNAVAAQKLKDNAVITQKISDAAVTSAKLAPSIALTGDPTAPTPPALDNDTSIATTAFVQAAVVQSGPLAGFRNLLINANQHINQRGYGSGSATSGSNQYTIDRWRVVTSGQNLSWTVSNGTYTYTAPAGGVEQVVEAASNLGGQHTLNWTGTATATVNGSSVAKGGQVTPTGNTNITVRFSGGTFSLPQLEPGPVATPFERRPIGTELALCQRYYEQSWPAGNTYAGFRGAGGEGGFTSQAVAATGYLEKQISFKVEKRAIPSITTYLTNSPYTSGKVLIAPPDEVRDGVAFGQSTVGFGCYAFGSYSKSYISFAWQAEAEL